MNKLMNLPLYFLYLIIYSIIGWIYESIYCSIDNKRLINRGFLNGPYCPIYGFGALFDILILSDVKNALIIFILSMIITGILEYFTSFIMELVFNARWWDYSDKKFNLNGRICLSSVIAFGCFSLILLKFIHPFIFSLIYKISYHIQCILSIIIFFVIFIDIIYTSSKLFAFKKHLFEVMELLDEAFHLVKDIYDKTSSNLYRKFKKTNYQMYRMLVSFPKLKSMKNNESLKKLRDWILREIEKGKDIKRKIKKQKK